jgi:hypothetical protein
MTKKSEAKESSWRGYISKGCLIVAIVGLFIMVGILIGSIWYLQDCGTVRYCSPTNAPANTITPNSVLANSYGTNLQIPKKFGNQIDITNSTYGGFTINVAGKGFMPTCYIWISHYNYTIVEVELPQVENDFCGHIVVIRYD